MSKRKKEVGPGRPTAYTPAAARVARVMSLGGHNQAAIAEALGQSEVTITHWKKKHPEFAKAINARRDETGKVIESVLKRAKGFSRKAVKPTTLTDGPGLGGYIVDHPIIEYFPPDMVAALAWMKRHDPEWRAALNNKPVEVEGAGQFQIVIDADTLELAGAR